MIRNEDGRKQIVFMMNSKSLISWLMAASVLLVGAVLPTPAAILSQWTFEASLPTTAGPISPEVGSGTGTAFHEDPDTVYSAPGGNGSAASWSADHWTMGGYFQFQIDTLGYQNIVVSWDQIRSSDGPSSFDFAYSLDGDAFTFVDNVLLDLDWSSYSFDLSSMLELNNASTVYFRVEHPALVNFGDPDPDDPSTPEGTSQIDNFTVSATSVSTAVPDSLPFGFTAAVIGLLVLSRRFSGTRSLN